MVRMCTIASLDGLQLGSNLDRDGRGAPIHGGRCRMGLTQPRERRACRDRPPCAPRDRFAVSRCHCPTSCTSRIAALAGDGTAQARTGDLGAGDARAALFQMFSPSGNVFDPWSAVVTFVAGLFWGWLYAWQVGLVGVSVSHVLLGATPESLPLPPAPTAWPSPPASRRPAWCAGGARADRSRAECGGSARLLEAVDPRGDVGCGHRAHN